MIVPALSSELHPNHVAWVGVPHDANSSFMTGPAEAPSAIREVIAGDSANGCAESGVDVMQHARFIDLGDLAVANDASGYHTLEPSFEELLGKDAKLIAIGGDHAITYPIVKATHQRYPDLRILHFDAHPDLYNEYEGNRFMHSCPFARIMEGGHAAALVQVGIRTMNPHQQAQADRFGVEVVDMRAWHGDPVGSRDRIQTLLSDAPVYLSFDMDVFDPAAAPGVSHHEPGGMMPREVLDLLQSLDLNLVGADVVELNPMRDFHGMTAMLAYKVLKELTGMMVAADIGGSCQR